MTSLMVHQLLEKDVKPPQTEITHRSDSGCGCSNNEVTHHSDSGCGCSNSEVTHHSDSGCGCSNNKVVKCCSKWAASLKNHLWPTWHFLLLLFRDIAWSRALAPIKHWHFWMSTRNLMTALRRNTKSWSTNPRLVFVLPHFMVQWHTI